MFKKIMLFFAILLASVSVSKAQDCNGSYLGTLDVVKMNDKNYDKVSNQAFTISNFNLTGKVAKIGKMPGDINIDLDIDENDGQLSSSSSQCGTLNVFGFIPVKLYLTSFSGSCTGNTIEFTIKCTGLYKGSSIAAEVHYTGSK